MVKITILIDNESHGKNLQSEFGLSFLIEDEDKSFIFDTGQTGKFLENAKELGIDLHKIKDIVLSHSHYDHTGGLRSFVDEISNDFTLHIHEKFFEEKHRITKLLREFIGNNFDRKYIEDNNIKVNYIKNDTYKISKNITIHTNFKEYNDFEKPTPYYYRKIYDNYILDHMEDELVLEIDTDKGVYILCGCSHIGIANIIENIKRRTNKKIYGLIGGLHLRKASDERLNAVINYFKENNIEHFATCHCTGDRFGFNSTELKEELPFLKI